MEEEKKKSMQAMFKILTEGRRAKNTLRGMNVGMYPSSDKTALQIKMLLWLEQFPISPQ